MQIQKSKVVIVLIYSIEGFKQMYKYIGEDDMHFTKGKEYGLIETGDYFGENIYGAFMQWDEYDGFDVDQCVFVKKSSFSKRFQGDFPYESELRPVRGERLYVKEKLKKKHKNLLINMIGRDFVERMESSSELHKIRLSCGCDYCKAGLRAKNIRKEIEMDDRLSEYYNDL